MLSPTTLARAAFTFGEYAGRTLGDAAGTLLGPGRLPQALRLLERQVPLETRLGRRLPALCAVFGDVEGAANGMRRRVEHLARTQAAAQELPRTPARRAAPRVMAEADARAALHVVVGRLREAGVTPFLSFGTLLGAVRENGFLAHDGDIDLGVFADQADVPRLRRLFQQGPFRRGLFQRSPSLRGPELRLALASRLNAQGSPVKLRHRSGVSIDLVPFERRPDAFITRLVYQNHALERRRRPFALRPLCFAGVDVWVPDPPEAFLEENYGNWRVPDTDYHYVLSSRMPFDPGHVLVHFFLYHSLVAALERGARLRARGLARQALARGMCDPVLTLLAELDAEPETRSREREAECASIPR